MGGARTQPDTPPSTPVIGQTDRLRAMEMVCVVSPPGSISTADGSALLHSGDTVVLCGVKAVSSPPPSHCPTSLKPRPPSEEERGYAYKCLTVSHLTLLQELANPAVSSPSQGYLGEHTVVCHLAGCQSQSLLCHSVQCGDTSLLFCPPLLRPSLSSGTGTLAVTAGHTAQVHNTI